MAGAKEITCKLKDDPLPDRAAGFRAAAAREAAVGEAAAARTASPVPGPEQGGAQSAALLSGGQGGARHGGQNTAAAPAAATTTVTPGEQALQQITLAVENMNCGGCMRKVERALLAVPGVESARANLSARRVSVLHKPGATDLDSVVAALADAGYKAGELVAADDAKEAAREKAFLRRLGVAGFAMMNVMLLSVSVWSAGKDGMSPATHALFHWLSALIALPAIVYAGQPFFSSAWSALKHRALNMDVPISLGVVLASGMSLFQTMRGGDDVYFDAAITLLFFLLIGRYLDQRMRSRAQGAAQNLIGMISTTATMITEDGELRRLPAAALEAGMKVLVPVGERVPADGRLLSATGEVDDSILTGESLPHRVAAGEQIYAGTLNLSAPLTIAATATENDTLLAEISRLMQAAEQGRGRYVRLADRAAAIYAPLVHILALGSLLAWLAFGVGWQAALTSAIAVLIVTCPCALALAVPAVQVAASSRLFELGVILKAPDALERLAAADWIVFDKTGTLSRGVPKLVGCDPPVDEALLRRAAALGAHSHHPYARALVAAAATGTIAPAGAGAESGTGSGSGNSFAAAASGDGDHVLTPAAAASGDGRAGDHMSPLAALAAAGGEDGASCEVEEVAGCGLRRALANGEERLGSADWVGLADAPDAPNAVAASLYYSAPGMRRPIALRFEDELRQDAADVVARLKEAGYGVELISGDRFEAVRSAAEGAGIAKWSARAKPQDKIARLEALQQDGFNTIMIGDGLNDAPALAAAHASLSPSSASQLSQMAADAIIQGEDLSPLIEILAVARASKRMALQNFAIAAGYNAFFVPLAMAGVVTPLIAAIAMSASSIAVTANAIRLRHRKLRLAKITTGALS